jgi:hypothetical protein
VLVPHIPLHLRFAQAGLFAQLLAGFLLRSKRGWEMLLVFESLRD